MMDDQGGLLNLPLPADPVQLRGADPSQAQMAPAPPPPPAQSGLFQRLGSLLPHFHAPIDQSIRGFLNPEQQQYLKRQMYLDLGTRLMQAGGPRPQGTANFLSRLGEAGSGFAADARGMQEEALQRAMQMHQLELMYGGQQGNQPGPGATPSDQIQWYQGMARRMAGAGPLGLQYAKTYSDLAESIKRSMPETHTIENVTGRKGGQYEGQNVDQLVDPQGNVLAEFPKTKLTPEQASQRNLEIRNSYDREMKPLNDAAVAVRQWRQNVKGKSDRVSDSIRLQIAKQVLAAHGGGEINPAQGQFIDQLAAKFGMDPRGLDPESRGTLDSLIEGAIPDLERSAKYEYNWTIGQLKAANLSTDNYVNLWDDVPTASGSPKPKAAHPGVVTPP